MWYDRVCFSSLMFVLWNSRAIDSTLGVDDFGEEFGRNCTVTDDATVRCVIEVNSVLCRFQICHKHQFKMFLQVEVRLKQKVGTLIQRRNKRENLL